MKKIYTLLTAMLVSGLTQAQTVSSFSEMYLAPDSHYDGSDFSGGMNSGNAFFYNRYDTTFGAAYGYWAEGWAISNQYDTLTQASDYSTQLYSAKEVLSLTDSNFAVGTQGSRIVLTGSAIGKSVSGFFITNSTYAYNSMKLGDSFAKKFGGASGNDPDFFKLVVKKYQGGTLGSDSVEFYLADYRFADNSQDYLVKQWTWVDLTSLGNADSLEFTLRSSDAGSFGINTPAYYCIDNFTTNDSPTGITDLKTKNTLSVYPNPFVNTLNTSGMPANAVYRISNLDGQTLVSGRFSHSASIDLSALPAGIYLLNADQQTIKLVKQE
jgi:hypothetical protein